MKITKHVARTSSLRNKLVGGTALLAFSCLYSSPALAIDVTAPPSDFVIIFEPNPDGICTFFSNDRFIVGTDDEQFFLRDLYAHGVGDANGIGINNLGMPFDVRNNVRSIQIGSPPASAQGFLRPSQQPRPLFYFLFDVDANGENPIELLRVEIPDSVFDNSPPECQPATNEPPVADAGTDVSGVVPGSTVTLDGTASSDPDDDAITYRWTQVSGPAVTLDDPTSPTPSFTAPGGAGDQPIVFQLIVNDGTEDSQIDTVTVSIQDNVSTARQAISEFLSERNLLLLSHQPDIQRRIDRLEGRSQGGRGVSINGAFLPGSENAPLQLAANGPEVSFAASLSSARGQRDSAVAKSFDIWAEAYLSDFEFGAREGDFRVFYIGADYALSENLLIGVLGQIDDIEYDGRNITGVRDGDGWMVGPYLTARLSENLFVDARTAWGESGNRVSPFGTYVDEFDTSRFLVSGTLTGEIQFSDAFMVRPEVAGHYISEKQKSYTDSLNSVIPSQKIDQGQISFAPRFHYDAKLSENWLLRPYAEAKGIVSFGDSPVSLIGDDFRLRLEGGADLFSDDGFRASISYFHDGIGMNNYESNGFRFSLAFTF